MATFNKTSSAGGNPSTEPEFRALNKPWVNVNKEIKAIEIKPYTEQDMRNAWNAAKAGQQGILSFDTWLKTYNNGKSNSSPSKEGN
jgi:hypothetical protein